MKNMYLELSYRLPIIDKGRDSDRGEWFRVVWLVLAGLEYGISTLPRSLLKNSALGDGLHRVYTAHR